jgi:hypothetical protein
MSDKELLYFEDFFGSTDALAAQSRGTMGAARRIESERQTSLLFHK